MAMLIGRTIQVDINVMDVESGSERQNAISFFIGVLADTESEDDNLPHLGVLLHELRAAITNLPFEVQFIVD